MFWNKHYCRHRNCPQRFAGLSAASTSTSGATGFGASISAPEGGSAGIDEFQGFFQPECHHWGSY
jgi:hypothetical protein